MARTYARIGKGRRTSEKYEGLRGLIKVAYFFSTPRAAASAFAFEVNCNNATLKTPKPIHTSHLHPTCTVHTPHHLGTSARLSPARLQTAGV